MRRCYAAAQSADSNSGPVGNLLTAHAEGSLAGPQRWAMVNWKAAVRGWHPGVNVAAHLLVDVLVGGFDAAVVISNDSDLRWPVQEARRRVPVGVVTPGSGYTTGHLSGVPTAGAGRHWWCTLRAADFAGHQLPDPVGRNQRPAGW
jgi:hypothetical protein